MISSYSDLMQRLERCEMELQASRGYIKALEYGLRAVIACEPEAERLAAVWAHVLLEASEEHQGDAASSPLFHAALQHALSVVTEQIQQAMPGTDLGASYDETAH